MGKKRLTDPELNCPLLRPLGIMLDVSFLALKFPRQPNSMKTAEVFYAKLQGKEANIEHYSERAEQGAIQFWVR
jgi:hypothetical protein